MVDSHFLNLKVKSREEKDRLDYIVTSKDRNGYTYSDFPVEFTKRVQTTHSEGHPWHSRERKHGDIGGPFRTSQRYYSDGVHAGPKSPSDILPYVSAYHESTSLPIGGGYQGWQWPISFTDSIIRSTLDSVWPQEAESSVSELMAHGTVAIERCKPTNSTAELAVSLAEVYREGIPDLPGVQTWRKRSEALRKNGSGEYLNLVFGWLPLVQEVKNVSYAAQRQDELWNQYLKDAGKTIRRSYEFPVVRSQTPIATSSMSVPYPAMGYAAVGGQSGTRTRTRHVYQRRWFDGAFSYYIPGRELEGPWGSLVDAAYKARAVYGATLDPEVLWNLAPWSWAADWFVNAGSLISNVSDMAIDGLVMRYGYMMEHTIVADELRVTGGVLKNGDRLPPRSVYQVTETKQRIAASPYGFGLTWEGFSPRQLSILAALGFSRV